MDDLIRRQDAIDTVNEERGEHGMIKDILCDKILIFINNKIRRLPSVQSEPKWIPVSERLPESNQLIGKTRKYYLVQDEYGDMLTASYNKRADGFIYWEQMYDIEPLHYEVVAWMELPEPYERREHGEKNMV